MDTTQTDSPQSESQTVSEPVAGEHFPTEQPQAEQPQSEQAQATEQPQSAELAQAEQAQVEQAQAGTPAQSAEQPRRSRQPSMAQVMESDEFSAYLSGADNLARNALLKGVVAHVDESTGVLLVDVGAKSEGIVPKNEVGDDEINIGDEIEVVVLQSENEDGHPVLSKRRADYERLWRSIIAARDEQTPLQATVTREVKGGLIVDLGVSAFVPASQVSTRNRSSLGHMVGKTIPVRVIEVDRKKDKVIASHRQAADVERREREDEAWKHLEKDKVVEGIVRRITDFGAFVDIGGIDGLLHVREMAWNRVEHPSHVVKKGQKLQVLILDIDEDRKRVALGLKQLQSDPWKKAAAKYRTGQTVTGKVTHIAPSCAFVELEEGIEAIIPISEMSEERIKTPEDVLKVGDDVEARVKTVQPGQRKITLSLRAAVRDKERRETRDAIREVNQRATEGGESGGGGALKLGDIFGAQLREARERTKERKKTRDEARTRAQQLAEEEEWDGDEDTFEAEAADNYSDAGNGDAGSGDADSGDADNGDANNGEDVATLADETPVNVAAASSSAAAADESTLDASDVAEINDAEAADAEAEDAEVADAEDEAQASPS